MPDAKEPMTIPLIHGLSSLAGRYDGLLVDLWGCLHDGIDAHGPAVDALVAFRRLGGRVVLLSNAPRTPQAVARQLEAMGVPDGAWDGIMTAGLATRLAVEEGEDPWYAALGPRFWHLGTERDACLLEGLARERCTSVGDADFVLCCGIRRPGETLDDIMPELEPALERGLPMLSANPDRFVLRGEVREICAGTIADAYVARGGRMRQEGKPFPSVYRRCLDMLAGVLPERVLAVGDGIGTDIVGARDSGIDAVWITGGLPAHFWGIAPERIPPRTLVDDACRRHGVTPAGIMPMLAW